MNPILIKLFATALTLSQVTTRPEAIRTQFDPATDGPEVVRILRDGCAHMRKAFDIEDINLDDLISTAMEDPKAVAGESKLLHGLDIAELNTSYKQFCKGENPAGSPFEARAVIEFFNKAVADLPDAAALKTLRLPGATTILDGRGNRFSETFEPNGRRIAVPVGEIPPLVQKAFIAAEDKRFESHRGIDERGVIRAFIGNLASPGRPQGGSTITQQVVKNLSVGDDVTYERKIREMIVAARAERMMTKPEILGLYLNGIYLGRGAYGVEMAARSYFGKSVRDLGVAEAALLAGMPKGPNYYSPDRYPERARERRAYVLSRMKEEGAITEGEMNAAMAAALSLAPLERTRQEAGFHFVDHLAREARTLAGLDSLTAGTYTVRSTLNAGLQTATESILQESLARYEAATGRARFESPEMNLADAVRRIEAAGPEAPTPGAPEPPAPADAKAPSPRSAGAGSAGAKPAGLKPAGLKSPGPTAPGPKPAWRRALETARPPLYDVHWPLAVVLDTGGRTGARVGLADGRVASLNAGAARGRLAPYDVVRVSLRDPRAAQPRADLRVRPQVQGAVLVMENRTGRILALAGGFSYPLSQLNRVTQAVRQPGSTLKPLTYLAALASGLQPNTLVMDARVTLPPIGGVGESWSPKNYEGGGSGPTTLRRGLEHSKNLVTAQLLKGGIAEKPQASLQRICDIALEAQLYAECERYYPFVLGAQPVRMIDLATFYAAVANEGERPSPYGLESVSQGPRTLYQHAERPMPRLGSADRVAFYQLKSLLQGVTQRGTAAALGRFAPYVAGKTGTSEDENDAWFAGFTNEITIVAWIGYDNADGRRRTLGRGQTGGHLAVPVFAQVLQAAWANGVPRSPLAPPSPEARRLIADAPIDLHSGSRVAGGGFMEHFRLQVDGRLADTRYRLVPQESLYALRPDAEPDGDAPEGAPEPDAAPDAERYDPFGSLFGQPAPERAPYARRAQPVPAPEPIWPGPRARSPFGDDDFDRRPRRRDPDYPFGRDPTY
ncbi:Biosynthetic peptidoglycan transglycosylase [Methylobacterium crusticola]|uniref:peptidoglycan glycosyltransferase n=1 Tax=Methylobacterium crusticola TaxID=1697972 RepID=A0ABQ4QTY6_9HYPH|nr:transglycosylase domain-containing protein [Methylobacterium crusticola]GJD48795.1 Biosynthetic peptidoglycan transglycosylase [Methylobacterium crusticola]